MHLHVPGIEYSGHAVKHSFMHRIRKAGSCFFAPPGNPVRHRTGSSFFADGSSSLCRRLNERLQVVLRHRLHHVAHGVRFENEVSRSMSDHPPDPIAEHAPATAPIAVPIPGISDVPSIAPYSTPEILVTSAAVMVGMPIPLVPIQILLMNLLTDALPAMVLAVNPGSKGTKETRQVDIVDKQLYRKVITRGVLLGLGSLGLFALTLASGAPVHVAQSVAFATCYYKQRPLDDKRAYLQDFF